MNAQADTQTRQLAKVPVTAGGQVAALVPQSMEEAFRVAQAIAASGLAPKGLDKPEQVLVAIMAGAELGLAPFQSLQSIAVVNGRPTLYGDGLVAIVRAQGARIKEWLEGEGETLMARCEVTRPDGEVIGAQFSVADAKKAALWGKAGPWQQYPRRMLAMRARAWALRDGCADMLRGFQVREEVEDVHAREIKPAEGTGMRARLEGRGPAVGGFDPEHIETELAEVQDAEFHDPETGEVVEAEAEPGPSIQGEHLNKAEALGMKTGAQLLAEQEAQQLSDDQGPGVAEQAPPDGQAAFPGDRPAAPANRTRADRVNAVKVAMAKAPDQASLDAIWARTKALQTECEATDPEGLYIDLLESHEAAERALEAVSG